jgi:NADH-quinone oxidoreductase subunit G
MRILPQACEDINEEWISDRTRFSYDGLKYQRLDRAFVRENTSLNPVDYKFAIEKAAELIKVADNIGIIIGKLSDVETIFAAKTLLNKFGSGYIDFEVSLHDLVSKSRGDYIFNSTIAGIEEADQLLLINTNPRHEAAIINGRIRKAVVHNKMQVAFIGPKIDLNYHYEELGDNSLKALKDLLSGEHNYCKLLEDAKKPMMIIGSGVSEGLLKLCKKVAQKYSFISPEWNGLNILHHSAGAVGALDMGIVNHSVKKKKLSDCETVILFGADDVDLELLKGKKVIYIGHHGDNSVYRADIIIPSPAFLEKSGTYVNTEGRVQRTTQAVKQLGDARPEYQIVLDIAKELEFKIDFVDLDSTREYIAKENKIFIKENLWNIIPSKVDLNLPEEVKVKSHKFTYPITNFYMTDSISRSSKIMAECVKVNNL